MYRVAIEPTDEHKVPSTITIIIITTTTIVIIIIHAVQDHCFDQWMDA
jgi:hypothetical protein